MQRGADVAHGKYLIFCNSGDSIFGQEYLSRAVEQLGKANLDWGYGPIIEHTQRDTYAWVPANFSATAASIIARRDFVAFPSFIIKKELFQKLGGFSGNYKIAGDFELICKTALAGNPFVFSEPIAQFTAGGISYTKADLAWKEEISIRRELLKLNYLQTFKELMKFWLRFTKWNVGKLLDEIEKYSSKSPISWRDKRAHQVPEIYLSNLN
jgi:hypothetical protein